MEDTLETVIQADETLCISIPPRMYPHLPGRPDYRKSGQTPLKPSNQYIFSSHTSNGDVTN